MSQKPQILKEIKSIITQPEKVVNLKILTPNLSDGSPGFDTKKIFESFTEEQKTRHDIETKLIKKLPWSTPRYTKKGIIIANAQRKIERRIKIVQQFGSQFQNIRFELSTEKNAIRAGTEKLEGFVLTISKNKNFVKKLSTDEYEQRQLMEQLTYIFKFITHNPVIYVQ